MTKSKGIRPPRVHWSDSHVEQLRALYPDAKTADIATALGRTESQVYAKASSLGLKKSTVYLASPASCRLRRGDNIGSGTRFQKGHPTWNKGMKGLRIGGEATQFKPGHRGGKALLNYKPIGTERISKDGYLERKINDDMPLQKRWRAVHLLVWEEVNGPLPPGHAVAFKDGNKRNISTDNLELISRSDLMRRNTVHNLPKEVAELVQLRGALKRKINRLEKKDERHY